MSEHFFQTCRPMPQVPHHLDKGMNVQQRQLLLQDLLMHRMCPSAKYVRSSKRTCRHRPCGGPGQHDRQLAVRLSEHSSMTSIMSISRPVLDAQRTQHSKHHEDQVGIALLSALLSRSMMSISCPFHYQLPQTCEHQQNLRRGPEHHYAEHHKPQLAIALSGAPATARIISISLLLVRTAARSIMSVRWRSLCPVPGICSVRREHHQHQLAVVLG